MNTSPHRVPSALLDEVEAAFGHKLTPSLSWNERDIGYAVGVAEILAFLRTKEVKTTLSEPHIINVGG